MNFQDPEQVNLLAGEYVLGVLPLAQQAAFEQELLHNRALVVAVGYWRDRLLEMAPPPVPVEPAASLWQRIERSLPGRAGAPGRGWWNSLSFWRFSGALGVLASAVLVMKLVAVVPQAASAPQFLAVLQAPATGTNWLVEVDDRVVRLRPLSPTAVVAGKSVQFWTKPVGAAGPTSLGLVRTDRPTEIARSLLPGMSPNQLFEVTLEPQDGSPLPRPTGPILAVGRAILL
ncbi:anti-sigma factor [Actimicrobium sp. CCC2.4]|uniref:anti-sigma factor n=1 Tax=Actimicrobium sp. CCC2.4 TaxID=3048606 RepID=UPI002AC92C8F|nr:anti-sigma factor [Actimicrobium sp. CCC2.4]MEB0134176.1 anti-sigma factor [Actimicrobium sp. CCC2.4]WPX32831.1 anti-sigma factor [Actimicrobium sp. CCC2.4]